MWTDTEECMDEIDFCHMWTNKGYSSEWAKQQWEDLRASDADRKELPGRPLKIWVPRNETRVKRRKRAITGQYEESSKAFKATDKDADELKRFVVRNQAAFEDPFIQAAGWNNASGSQDPAPSPEKENLQSTQMQPLTLRMMRSDSSKR